MNINNKHYIYSTSAFSITLLCIALYVYFKSGASVDFYFISAMSILGLVGLYSMIQKPKYTIAIFMTLLGLHFMGSAGVNWYEALKE